MSIARWRWIPAAGAPVLMIGGWTAAARLQPGSFDSVRTTISSLAARGTPDRWLMTGALAGTGLCYLATAVGLREGGRPGRVLLGAGGIGTVLVAAFPQPHDGSSAAHTAAASAAFGALALWPALAARRDAGVPAALRPAVAVGASAVLLGLVGWFTAELGGAQVGLAERVAAGAEALWPLVVVTKVAWSTRRSPERP
jgi:hypothetical membrane protein